MHENLFYMLMMILDLNHINNLFSKILFMEHIEFRKRYTQEKFKIELHEIELLYTPVYQKQWPLPFGFTDRTLWEDLKKRLQSEDVLSNNITQ